MEWISVRDKKPTKEYGYFLFLTESYNLPYIGQFKDGGIFLDDEQCFPKYWMPLPESPKG